MASRLLLAGIAALALAIGGAIEACGGNDNQSVNTEIRTEAPRTPSTTPLAESPTPTPELPKATPTTTEGVQEVPCQIVPIEYCSQAERVLLVYSGTAYTYIALNLPAGVPLSTPSDGLSDETEASGDPFSGVDLALFDCSGTTVAKFVGDIRTTSEIQEHRRAGDILGYVSDTGIKNFGATILFRYSNEEATKSLFPAAFEKPVKQTIHKEGPGKPTVHTWYGDYPPGDLRNCSQ